MAGTAFNWTRNNTGTVTGIGAFGSGNITGVLVNTSSAPITVTFTIIPTANGCTGNFIFKAVGVVLAVPLMGDAQALLQTYVPEVHQQVVLFHLGFNVLMAMTFIGLTGPMARLVERILPKPSNEAGSDRPRHLDPVALATPSLAISFPHREEALAAFSEGLLRYRRRDWAGAEHCFSAALAANPEDGPSKIYFERCRIYGSTPPSAAWDGVWTMPHK